MFQKKGLKTRAVELPLIIIASALVITGFVFIGTVGAGSAQLSLDSLYPTDQQNATDQQTTTSQNATSQNATVTVKVSHASFAPNADGFFNVKSNVSYVTEPSSVGKNARFVQKIFSNDTLIKTSQFPNSNSSIPLLENGTLSLTSSSTTFKQGFENSNPVKVQVYGEDVESGKIISTIEQFSISRNQTITP